MNCQFAITSKHMNTKKQSQTSTQHIKNTEIHHVTQGHEGGPQARRKIHFIKRLQTNRNLVRKI